MDVKMHPSWKEKLDPFFQGEKFPQLAAFVKEEYKTHRIFPPAPWIFRAFDLCPFERTRVVILGQDPYHGPGQANGLCFSVGEEVKLPPSLVNIFKEIRTDLGRDPHTPRDLIYWARQGVLLLNATLTVRDGAPGSHQKKGWEELTTLAVEKLAQKKEGLVFILWGAYAQKKAESVDPARHCLIRSPHPSPLSAHRGFFGSKPFSRTNEYLLSKGDKPIDW